jgi:hypothetical protein
MSAAERRPIIEPSRLRTEHEMELGTVIAATTDTSWPEAAIAIAGVALVASVAVVVIWQALATWRTRIEVSRDEAYRKLAEQMARELHEIHEQVLDIALRIQEGDRREEDR